MRGLLLLANGFEDTEALTTRDVLIRSGVDVVTASIHDEQVVLSSFGVNVLANVLLKDIESFNGFDFLVLPGGGKGTMNLASSDLVANTIFDFHENGKLIAAICAAPSILGNMELLKGKRYTCFAGCDKGIEGNFTGNEVEVDGEIITARSMMYSIPFALAIVEKLLGEQAKERTLIGLKGQVAK